MNLRQLRRLYRKILRPAPSPADPVAYVIAYYGDVGRLANTWYMYPHNAAVAIAGIQAAEIEDSELLQARLDILHWLDQAKLGDTYNPGWGVVFIAKVRLGEEVTGEVEDWDEYTSRGGL